MTSETFLPTLQEIPGHENSYFVDIAGLKDTGGDLMEFINQFINKKLFGSIKNLKILIPITLTSIKVARGGPVTEQLEILMKTFQKNPSEMSKSIIPVLTKVNPKDEEFEFDSVKHDLQ